MAGENRASTETSPLLPKSRNDEDEVIEEVEGEEEEPTVPESGVADFGPDGWSEEAARARRYSGPEGWAQDVAARRRFSASGDDAQRRRSSAGRQKQFEGLPEVRARMKYIMPALAIGVFLAAADQTIIVSSYGQIGSDLNALDRTSWIATAYFLTLTSFQPLYGKLSDIFTRKSCLLVAYLIFGLGCLFCGLAQNINQLIAARAFAGIGGGGMATVVSIMLSDIIPLKDRGTWQGYINVIYAAGAGAGAPLGGILADGIGWRWAFLIQAPMCLVAFFAVWLTLNMPAKDAGENWTQRLRRIDFLGAAILIAAVFLLLLGLDRGSNLSWRSKICLIPLCFSFPLFAIFVYVEVKVAKEPFAPGRVIFVRSLFACFLCNFFSFGGWLSALFYIPLYYQAVQGRTATDAGVLLIPGIIAGVCGSLFGGFYMQRTGKYFRITVACYSGLTVGMLVVLLCSGAVTDSTVGIVIGSCIAGFSNGIGVTTTLIGLISNAKREDQAIATACSYLFRSLGSTTGLSLTSTVANQTLRSTLTNALGSGKNAAEIAEGVRRSLRYISTLNPETAKIVRNCFEHSTRAAFGFDMAVVLGAAISAWFIQEKPLSAK